MSTLIFGGYGWLANRLKERWPDAIQSEADITDWKSISQDLRRRRPTVVVNCAGKTGRPNVDWCENHPVETMLSNVAGPMILAAECLDRGIFFAHVGSGCIYEGTEKKPFRETDMPNFSGSLYSRSKAVGERALKEFPVLQARIRMPFDGRPHPRNLITKLLGYKKIISVPNSLTCVDDFVMVFQELIEQRQTGIWNIVNPGAVTHSRVLELYSEIVAPSHRFEVMGLEELEKRVKAGRSNCVLSIRKLEDAGISVRPIEDALRAALGQYRENLPYVDRPLSSHPAP